MGLRWTPTPFILRTQLRHGGRISPRWNSTIARDALRILFCGSDEFSIASLKALRTEQLQRPRTIESIEVICRPGKRVGRDLKTIREGRDHDMHSAARSLLS
jgi:methionyl-tRNA formyltransferase